MDKQLFELKLEQFIDAANELNRWEQEWRHVNHNLTNKLRGTESTKSPNVIARLRLELPEVRTRETQLWKRVEECRNKYEKAMKELFND